MRLSVFITAALSLSFNVNTIGQLIALVFDGILLERASRIPHACPEREGIDEVRLFWESRVQIRAAGVLGHLIPQDCRRNVAIACITSESVRYIQVKIHFSGNPDVTCVMSGVPSW